MPRIVRGALLQATWTGDKESMIQKHEAGRPRGRQAGRPGDALPGAVLRALLLPGAGRRSTTATPSSSRTARPRSGCRTSPSRPGMVLVVPMYEEDATGVGHLLQHRRRHRRRRQVPRQVPQDPHPARQGLLGEVLLPAREHGLPGVRDRGRQGRRLHLLRPPLPGGRARARPQRRRDGVHPAAPRRAACPSTCGGSSRSATRWPTATSSGTINRVGIEPTRRRRLLRPELLRATRAASSSARSARRTTRS